MSYADVLKIGSELSNLLTLFWIYRIWKDIDRIEDKISIRSSEIK